MTDTSNGLLHHGGKLRQAAAHYAIPLAQWLDLSTGINPNGWPVPPPPATTWSRLPEEQDGLEQAARDYYGAEALLAVAGSQAAIQALPLLRSASRVAILGPTYAEHAHAWRRAGHNISTIVDGEINSAVAQSEVVVLVNPNNPTGIRFSVDQLLQWHERLAVRNGWLVVDEAFIDSTPEQSLCRYAHRSGLIVLRSLGKFFGLAGARVGFVCAAPALLEQLNGLLGPWSITGPARYVATLALQDRVWQAQARSRLVVEGERLRALLTGHGLAPARGCALFQWVPMAQAAILHDQLAQQGILTRLFTQPASLRFGLPADEPSWQRLDTALTSMKVPNHE